MEKNYTIQKSSNNSSNLLKNKNIEFESFISTMMNTNIYLEDLVDWNKIFKKKLENDFYINNFNYLISNTKEEFQEKIKILLKNNFDFSKNINYLLGFKEKNKWFIFNENEIKYQDINLKDFNNLILFFEKTGLINIFLNKQIKNINDYYLGIEVGLDSNSRKNRNGKNFENLIESILIKHSIFFQKQVSYNFENGKSKKFDFKINFNNNEYFIETNFYNTKGSKLDSICGEYIELNNELKKRNINFIWITDGKEGWKNNKNLEKAFSSIDNMFNFYLFKKWIKEIK